MLRKKKKKNKRIDLITVIAKVKQISEDRYDGKVYDHILTIFNELSTAEKRTLLRGLINICFIVEDKVLVNNTDLNHLRTKSSTSEGHGASTETGELRNVMKEVTEREKATLTKMQKLTSKADVILLVSGSLLIFTAVTQFEPHIYESILKYVVQVLKFIIVL